MPGACAARVLPPGYIPGLDGLRALSVLVVVLRHFEVSGYIPGGFGVTVFFFISGFLITRLLIAEKQRYAGVSLPRFYARRFLRLAPALLVMLAATAAAMLAAGKAFPGTELAAGALYFMNYYLVFTEGLPRADTGWGPLWSLAVEEHFYLVFPLLIAVCTRRRALLMVAAALALCPVLRAVYMQILQDGALYNYLATEVRIDSILWGSLLSLLAGRRLRWLEGRWAFPLALAGLLVGFLYRDPWFENVLKYSLQGACLFVCVFKLVVRGDYPRLLAFLELGPMRYTGRISYSIYLWHTHAFFLAGALLGGPSIVLALLLTFVFAALSYRLVELPLAGLRTRLRPLPANEKRPGEAAVQRPQAAGSPSRT